VLECGAGQALQKEAQTPPEKFGYLLDFSTFPATALDTRTTDGVLIRPVAPRVGNVMKIVIKYCVV
jgi:hypothetical protein